MRKMTRSGSNTKRAASIIADHQGTFKKLMPREIEPLCRRQLIVFGGGDNVDAAAHETRPTATAHVVMHKTKIAPTRIQKKKAFVGETLDSSCLSEKCRRQTSRNENRQIKPARNRFDLLRPSQHGTSPRKEEQPLATFSADFLQSFLDKRRRITGVFAHNLRIPRFEEDLFCEAIPRTVFGASRRGTTTNGACQEQSGGQAKFSSVHITSRE